MIEASELDKKFNNGEDISEFVDFSKARRPALEQKSVSIELPAWMVEALDKEAKRIGVTQQSIIKIWLAERLDRLPR